MPLVWKTYSEHKRTSMYVVSGSSFPSNVSGLPLRLALRSLLYSRCGSGGHLMYLMGFM